MNNQNLFHQKIKVSENDHHLLENDVLIAGFEVDLFDSIRPELFKEHLKEILKDLPTNIMMRVYLKAEFENLVSKNNSRFKAIEEIGFINHKAFIFLELIPSAFNFRKKENNAVNLKTYLSPLENMGSQLKPLNETEIIDLLPQFPKETDHRFQTMDQGKVCSSILRLKNLPEHELSLLTLSKAKDSLSVPYTICVSLIAMPQAQAETYLRRRSKQNSQASDIVEDRKLSEAQNALEGVLLEGERLFHMEWLCYLERDSEQKLRRDREAFRKSLSKIGEIYIESVGALNSLKAFYPGEAQHFTLLEKDGAVPLYMPMLSDGEPDSQKLLTNHSLLLHRRDESLTSLNFFDPRYQSYSWLILGQTGLGKSVFVNTLTRALMSDPNIQIIKIDVGGSHSKETEMLGGVEKTLSLNEPTGLNPFHILTDLGPTKEAIQILTAFLEVLILEEGETKLSKTMKSQLEHCVFFYADTKPASPSLQDFFDVTPDIPRKNLLSRWVNNGVYGNAFAVGEKPSKARPCGLDSADSRPDLRSSRLLYYNFSKISQALDPDYAQGGLAAVMAEFNYQMLIKSATNPQSQTPKANSPSLRDGTLKAQHNESRGARQAGLRTGDANTENGISNSSRDCQSQTPKANASSRRLVFVADETPFFIQKCFNFFNLSIANIRKEGHGFVTIAQKSSHLIVGGDTGIIDNSPQRVVFSIDGDREEFGKRLHLSEDSIQLIESLQRKNGAFAECFFQDPRGERVLRLRLSSEEYFSYSSKEEDKQKFKEIKAMLPSLTTKEIIQCLALS